MIKVYGDIMLDRWILGNTNRISPEAPVPVLLEEAQQYSIGGAGNLALNIKSINGNVALYGSIGQDDDGYKLLEMIGNTKIEANIASDHAVTTTKTRLVGQGGQHIMRWDREETYIGTSSLHRLLDSLTADDIVCVSDYAKGTVREQTVEKLLKRKCKVLVDPKQHPSYYTNAYLVKPNMKEYVEWFGEFDIRDAQQNLQTYGWEWLVVTDGANGMHIINAQESWHCKEEVREVADVTGAGDTVLAIIAYGIEQGRDVVESCKLACYGAARIVEKRGVAVVTKNDLSTGIVWTNGVFDILHIGHLKLLRHAHTLGKRLVVGINSDASVKRLKGETRPINDEQTRKAALLELGFIDEVIIFDEDTPLETLQNVLPNIIVKGGDYTVDTVVGNHLADVVIFPTIAGASTTKLIDKMNEVAE